MKAKHIILQLLAGTTIAATMPAHAVLITHDDAGGFRTTRNAGSAPVGRLTVNAVQTINSFGVDVDLFGSGNLDFLIFNAVTGALLYESGPKAFADTGGGFKFSDQFSFTFQVGTTYALTAASDVGGDYLVDFVANTVSDFNFLTGNQNLNGSFGNSTLDVQLNCCDVSTALNVGAAANVPEPSTLALVGLGIAGAMRMRRRRQ